MAFWERPAPALADREVLGQAPRSYILPLRTASARSGPRLDRGSGRRVAASLQLLAELLNGRR
jgi:hypothetical protein